LAAIDSNHFSQTSKISGVGFSNPKCRNMNFFIHALLVGGFTFPLVARFLARLTLVSPALTELNQSSFFSYEYEK
jgi:hypothetical protein